MESARKENGSGLMLPTAAQTLIELNHSLEQSQQQPVVVRQERSIAQIAWAGRWWLFLGLVVGLVGGGVFFEKMPKTYESRAEVFIDRPLTNADPLSLRMQGIASASPTTQASVLKSTAVLEAALTDPKVRESQTLAKTDEDPLVFLRRELMIKGTEEQEVVALTLRSRYPEEAAMILNAILDAYFKQQQAYAAMDPQTQTSEESAEEAAKPATNGLPSLHESGSQAMTDALIQGRLSQLAERHAQAELALAQAKAYLQSAEAAEWDIDHLVQIAMDAGGASDEQQSMLNNLEAYRQALTRAQRQVDTAPRDWGDQHRIMLIYQADLASAQRSLMEAENRTTEMIRSSLLDRVRVRQIERDMLADQLAADQVQAKELKHLPLVLLEVAQTQKKPVSPNLAKSLGVGGMGGIVLVLSLLVMLDLGRGERALASVEEARVSAERNVVVHEPRSAIASLQPRDLQMNNSSSPLLLGSVPRIAATHRLMTPEYDVAGSSVHHVRAILQILARKQDIRSLAFVSPTRGSGKTSLSMGVAASLVMSGTSCLVADCDLAGRLAKRGRTGNARANAEPVLRVGDTRSTIDGIACASGHLDPASLREDRPHTHENGHLQHGLGMAGLIDGLPFDQCVLDSTTPGLGLLPAHLVTRSHIGQMSDSLIGRLIREAKQRYNIVLMDTGLIPGSVEALLVASQVDAVVIVLDETVSMKEYQRMLSYLKLAGAVIAGVVFNKVTDDEACEQVIDTHAPSGLSPEEAKLYGSGILAASVLSDSASGFSEMDWERVEPDDVVNGIVKG